MSPTRPISSTSTGTAALPRPIWMMVRCKRSMPRVRCAPSTSPGPAVKMTQATRKRAGSGRNARSGCRTSQARPPAIAPSVKRRNKTRYCTAGSGQDRFDVLGSEVLSSRTENPEPEPQNSRTSNLRTVPIDKLSAIDLDVESVAVVLQCVVVHAQIQPAAARHVDRTFDRSDGERPSVADTRNQAADRHLGHRVS